MAAIPSFLLSESYIGLCGALHAVMFHSDAEVHKSLPPPGLRLASYTAKPGMHITATHEYSRSSDATLTQTFIAVICSVTIATAIFWKYRSFKTYARQWNGIDSTIVTCYWNNTFTYNNRTTSNIYQIIMTIANCTCHQYGNIILKHRPVRLV